MTQVAPQVMTSQPIFQAFFQGAMIIVGIFYQFRVFGQGNVRLVSQYVDVVTHVDAFPAVRVNKSYCIINWYSNLGKAVSLWFSFFF